MLLHYTKKLKELLYQEIKGNLKELKKN